ncbi:hypothetical protein E5083_07400 [Streptomyces bauhiniae]|uniref:Uncharacterized protein n=1 Tax=Streptomyces bauhiniae TaxID=2340725 RepID=A0A4Z1D9Z0_9ACTN|nr:hypothetical protein [Streptomyces bauhiniae]TGN79449.1 hypothetical protein E5083_07400 [Streptomyces bauhiniae]
MSSKQFTGSSISMPRAMKKPPKFMLRSLLKFAYPKTVEYLEDLLTPKLEAFFRRYEGERLVQH